MRKRNRRVKKNVAFTTNRMGVIALIICVFLSGIAFWMFDARCVAIQREIGKAEKVAKELFAKLDRKAVTRLEVHGYLPIREEKSEDREGGSYYYERHTRGEIRFESCMHVIKSFLRVEYQPNGKGGLFYIPDYQGDIRNLEIWYQMCWYLNTIT